MFRCSRLSHRTFSTFRRIILKNDNARSKLIYLQCKNKTSSAFSPNYGGKKLVLLCVGGAVSLGMFGALKQSYITAHAAEAVVMKEVEVEEGETKEEEVVVPELPEFPEEVQYLLIGGGTASYSAMRSILKTDVNAKILIISEETQVPYMRPPLSKELWFTDDQESAKQFQFMQWSGKTRDIFFEKSGFFCKPNQLNETGKKVAIANARKVVDLNANENVATLDNGVQIKYKKCLIATGGTPKNLPSIKNAGEDVEKRTTVFRTADDFLKLNDVTDNIGSVTVIGGGFMGSELSCALGHKGKKNGFEVNQIFPESGNMGMVLPEYLTKWTTNKVRQEGVNVVTEAMVSDVSMDGDKVKITTKSGDEIKSDHVVVAVGLGINTDLANSAGIEVDENIGGYRVNAELQARSNIWVAGDAACFYDVKLGRRRVEHHDHAVVSGRLAGENMTGAQKHYFHQSMFWSDLGPDIGYEAIGLVDSRLPTVGVFAKATERDTPKAALEEGIRNDSDNGCDDKSPVPTPELEAPPVNQTTPLGQREQFGKGVVFYLRDSKVVGVLLWNVFGRMPIARKVIRDQQSYEDYSELAKLFKIHSEE